MRVALWFVLLAAGCGYRGDSFSGPRGPFPGERVTVGCLDVGVAAVHDAEAEGPVIAYEFGNRCDRATGVDLGGVRVRGRTASGRDVAMTPYDPLGELRAVRLEARRIGREVIEYHAAIAEPVVMACVDLWALDGATRERREICLDVRSTAGAPRTAEVTP